jgi:DnaK suppressor protein
MMRAGNARLISLLLTKQTELSGSICSRDDIVIEKASDSFDEVQLMGERELAIRNLDRVAAVLRQVRQAIARIDDGSYGVCLQCEEDISPKLLTALPWAGFCIRCQEQIDCLQTDEGVTIALAGAA